MQPLDDAGAPPARVLGILLAGGPGTRLGLDVPKALARLGGETLLARARRTLARVADRVVVSAPRSLAAAFGVEVTPDPPDAAGPLAGVVAAFAGRRFAAALVLAVDLPFVRPETLTALLESLAGSAAVVPAPGGRRQPLAAAYAPEAARHFAARFADGERSISVALGGLEVKTLAGAALEALPGGEAAFFNLNTPADLAAAERRLGAGAAA